MVHATGEDPRWKRRLPVVIELSVIEASIDGGSTEGEDKVSKLDYYRIEGGEALPVAEVGFDRQLVGAL